MSVIHSEKADADHSRSTENQSEIETSDVSIEIPSELSETKLNQQEKSENKNSETSVESSEPKSEQRVKSSAQKSKIDVKKRVLEILADASSPRGDKSPRLQDLYVTTYDVASPGSSPELRKFYVSYFYVMFYIFTISSTYMLHVLNLTSVNKQNS